MMAERTLELQRDPRGINDEVSLLMREQIHAGKGNPNNTEQKDRVSVLHRQAPLSPGTLSDRMPGSFVLDLERSEIDAHLHLEPALEILWHSTRVPAGAASAILETAIEDHLSGFVYNLQRWDRLSEPVPGNHRLVPLPIPTLQDQANQQLAIASVEDIRLHNQHGLCLRVFVIGGGSSCHRGDGPIRPAGICLVDGRRVAARTTCEGPWAKQPGERKGHEQAHYDDAACDEQLSSVHDVGPSF